ncbi:MAG: hypothetical protein RI897_290 [Verrucomicrobiota bacterium]
MIRGRGLKTINALPPLPAKPQMSLIGRLSEPLKRPVYRKLTGPVWHVPGFAQLSALQSMTPKTQSDEAKG